MQKSICKNSQKDVQFIHPIKSKNTQNPKYEKYVTNKKHKTKNPTEGIKEEKKKKKKKEEEEEKTNTSYILNYW